MINPYSFDNSDLEEETTTASSGYGSYGQQSEPVHQYSLSSVERAKKSILDRISKELDVPEEYKDIVIRIIDKQLTKEILPEDIRITSQILSSYSSKLGSGRESSLPLALADVVNSPDLVLDDLCNYYESRRMLMVYHMIKGGIVSSVETLHMVSSIIDVTENTPIIGEILGSYSRLIEFAVEDVASDYRYFSNKVGKAPDQSLIDEGILTKCSKLEDLTLGRPPAYDYY